MSKLDVLTIGAATRDVFIQSARFQKREDPSAPAGFDACFPLGAKIDLDHILFDTGGGATNAAVTFARLGLKTACLARVGDDPGGHEVLTRLNKDRIDITHIQVDRKLGTGYSVILLAGSGHRTILVYRGAAQFIKAPEIKWDGMKPQWIYLTSVAGNAALLKNIFEHAAKKKIHVAWNPGNKEMELGLKKLTPWLLQCDLLFLNREEAAALAETAPRNLEAMTNHLGTLPRQALIITDGAHGAYLHARGTNWFTPARKLKAVNTTGAGDAFGSAFTAAAIKTGNLDTAMRAGMLNSQAVIMHMGAKTGILGSFPTTAQLKRITIKKI